MADELHSVKRRMLDFNRQCNKLKEEKAALVKRVSGVPNGSIGPSGIAGGARTPNIGDTDITDAAISGVLSWRDPAISIVSARPRTAVTASYRSKFVGGGFNLSQPAT